MTAVTEVDLRAYSLEAAEGLADRLNSDLVLGEEEPIRDASSTVTLQCRTESGHRYVRTMQSLRNLVLYSDRPSGHCPYCRGGGHHTTAMLLREAEEYGFLLADGAEEPTKVRHRTAWECKEAGHAYLDRSVGHMRQLKPGFSGNRCPDCKPLYVNGRRVSHNQMRLAEMLDARVNVRLAGARYWIDLLVDRPTNNEPVLVPIEYDDAWWHKGRTNKDGRRNKRIYAKYGRLVVIQAKDKLPSREEIEEAIQRTIRTGEIVTITTEEWEAWAREGEERETSKFWPDTPCGAYFARTVDRRGLAHTVSTGFHELAEMANVSRVQLLAAAVGLVEPKDVVRRVADACHEPPPKITKKEVRVGEWGDTPYALCGQLLIASRRLLGVHRNFAESIPCPTLQSWEQGRVPTSVPPMGISGTLFKIAREYQLELIELADLYCHFPDDVVGRMRRARYEWMARHGRPMSQGDLARQAGVTPSVLSAAHREGRITGAMLGRMAEALEVDPSTLEPALLDFPRSDSLGNRIRRARNYLAVARGEEVSQKAFWKELCEVLGKGDNSEPDRMDRYYGGQLEKYGHVTKMTIEEAVEGISSLTGLRPEWILEGNVP